MAPPVVLVAGAMANKPHNGGEAWVRLSWLRGLERLGCQVWFVEQIAEAHCTDDDGRSATFAESANLRWFRCVTEHFQLSGRSTLLCDSGEVEGVPLADLRDIAREALLVNVSGNLADPLIKGLCPRRAYVDIDPGYTQFWHAAGNPGPRLEGHDRFFTIGGNIGRPGCPIPTGGLPWRAMLQPVVLDDWPIAQPEAEPCDAGAARFTTVATWRGAFGAVEHDRRRFGLKVHEFRKFLGLAGLVPARFEAALAIHPSEVPDLDLLTAEGWHLADPRSVAGAPEAFAAYVAGSTAEFSVAQGLYVETQSGWFSDRTTRYLASGRPALVQDTGFSRDLPVGKGLVAFTTLGEAAAGAEAILADYDAHAVAAREVVQSFFDSDIVLGRFLEDCDLP